MLAISCHVRASSGSASASSSVLIIVAIVRRAGNSLSHSLLSPSVCLFFLVVVTVQRNENALTYCQH